MPCFRFTVCRMRTEMYFSTIRQKEDVGFLAPSLPFPLQWGPRIKEPPAASGFFQRRRELAFTGLSREVEATWNNWCSPNSRAAFGPTSLLCGRFMPIATPRARAREALLGEKLMPVGTYWQERDGLRNHELWEVRYVFPLLFSVYCINTYIIFLHI